MVWTSNWNGNIFGYASSTDLVNWSTPLQVQPFPTGNEQPNNVWAPEIFWDHVAEDYKIVWSSTLNSELNDGDGSEDWHGYDHRIYYISTTDFQTFSTPELLFQDEGYSVIDGHVAWQSTGPGANDGRWVMELKKEQDASMGGKNIRLAFSDAIISPSSFGNTTDPYVGAGTSIQNTNAEGPSMVYWDDEWLLYWDAYSAGHYAMASSTDLENWTDETSGLSYPVSHPRHGTAVVIDAGNVGWRIGMSRVDLDGSGSIDVEDFVVFTANHLTDLSGYGQLEQAARGDLDGDGDNDYSDFQLFKQDYIRYNGVEAFQALLAPVPEPGAASLAALLVSLLVARRSRAI